MHLNILAGHTFNGVPAKSISLKSISPSAYWICWAYVYLNAHLGLFFSSNASANNKVVATWILSYGLWSVAFFIIAAGIAFSLLTNRWACLMVFMTAGFSFKLLWAVALIFMIPEKGYVALSASIGMWFSLAAIQAIVMIYLYPRKVAAKNVERSINE